MNQVSVIVLNPAYVEEAELDEDGVNPANLIPFVSGNTPIITVPASEDENVAEDVVEDSDEDEDMQDFLEKLEELDKEVKELQKEVMDLLSLTPGDTISRQPAVVPHVEVWDTGKAWEQEYRLYPDSNRKEISDRLVTQVLDLLRIMQERIDQQTWNNKDLKLIDGLKATVMHFRLGRLTEKVLNSQSMKPHK